MDAPSFDQYPQQTVRQTLTKEANNYLDYLSNVDFTSIGFIIAYTLIGIFTVIGAVASAFKKINKNKP